MPSFKFYLFIFILFKVRQCAIPPPSTRGRGDLQNHRNERLVSGSGITLASEHRTRCWPGCRGSGSLCPGPCRCRRPASCLSPNRAAGPVRRPRWSCTARARRRSTERSARSSRWVLPDSKLRDPPEGLVSVPEPEPGARPPGQVNGLFTTRGADGRGTFISADMFGKIKQYFSASTKTAGSDYGPVLSAATPRGLRGNRSRRTPPRTSVSPEAEFQHGALTMTSSFL